MDKYELVAPTEEDLDRRAFYLATKREDIDKMLELLIDQRISNLNMRDEKGRTPLHYASAYGRIDAVKFLLKYGANKDIRDNYNKRAVDYAKENGYKDVVFLLERWGK